MSKAEYMEDAIKWASKKPVVTLKAQHEGYDPPQVFTNKETNHEVQADISFVVHGGAKHYSDVALKTEDQQALVTRWKLLSTMAAIKRGKLHLLAPRGHKSFAQGLVDQYNISAKVYAL